MYASGKIAASEVWAFRAVVHFQQAVVSAKSVWPKTMDLSKPETFMHLSRSITPIYGRGSPCQVFLCPHLKLSIKVSTRTIGSGVCCVPLNGAPGLYTQADGVRVDQTSDHTRITRRVRMRIFLT